MDKNTHPYFVPDSTQGNRRDTATLLVGTATEGDSEGPIPQREVAATQGGFRISERVYKALGWADDDEDDTVGDPDARQVPGQVVTSPLDSEDAPTEEEADAEEAGVEDYSTWEYADLKTAVKNRNIETVDQKQPTLIQALIAADAEEDADDEADADTEV